MKRISASLLLFLITGALLLFLAVADTEVSETIDSGRYQLLYINPESTSLIENSLKEGSIPYIGLSNAQVSYFDYTELKTVLLDDLGSVLDSRDPRWDDYLKKLPGLFTFQDQSNRMWDILFIQKGENLRLWQKKLEETLDPYPQESFFYQQNNSNPIVSILFALGFLFTYGIFFSKNKKRCIVLSLPWILGTFMFPSILPMVVVVSIIPLLSLEEWLFHYFTHKDHNPVAIYKQTEFIIKLIYLVFGIILNVYLLSTGEGLSYLVLFSSYLVSFAALALLIKISLYIETKREHSLFVPLNMCSFSNKTNKKVYFRNIAGILCFVTFTFGFISVSFQPGKVSRKNQVSVYQTENIVYNIFSEKGIMELSDDYKAHRAFQDTFFFGGKFKIPSLNESISLNVFDTEGSSLQEQQDVVFQFDESWFVSLYDELSSTNPVQLILTDYGILNIGLSVYIASGKSIGFLQQLGLFLSILFFLVVKMVVMRLNNKLFIKVRRNRKAA